MRREVEIANGTLVERGVTVQRTPVEVVFRPKAREEMLPAECIFIEIIFIACIRVQKDKSIRACC
jgi:hypothetical protein